METIYDVLVKQGEVIDPSQGLHGRYDIGIHAGKITAIERDIPIEKATMVLDATQYLVMPGLIDLHAHPAGALAEVGVNADELGVRQGVTTICDGGTLGCANFQAARAYINSHSKTDVFWFIHGCNIGQVVIPEIHGWHEIDPKMTLKVIEANRDIIRGVKFRAIGAAAKSVGIEGAKAIKKIAVDAGLPLMVHLGICFSEIGIPTLAGSVEPYTKLVLELLEKGDIITHVYTPKIGGMIKLDGSILREFREAIDRGVILDVAHGGTNFGLEYARIGIANGIIPHTISTDASSVAISMCAEKGMAKTSQRCVSADSSTCSPNVKEPFFGLAAIMSKFLALGFTLKQVIEMTTANPARALSEEHCRGSLKVGLKADITIMQLLEQDVTFPDRISDAKLEGKYVLVPKITLKSQEHSVEVVNSDS